MAESNEEPSVKELLNDFYSAIKEECISSSDEEEEEDPNKEEEGENNGEVPEEESSGEKSPEAENPPLNCPEQNLPTEENHVGMADADQESTGFEEADTMDQIQMDVTDEPEDQIVRENCPICDGNFESKTDWEEHLWKKHKSTVAVHKMTVFDVPAMLLQSLSGRTIFDRPIIDILEMAQTKIDRQTPKCYRCLTCSAQFASLCALLAHDQSPNSHNLSGSSGFEPARPDWSKCGGVLVSCSFCLGCFSVSDIGDHLGIHQTGSDGISCEICSTSVECGRTLREHYVAVHGNLFGSKEASTRVKVLRRIRPGISWNEVSESALLRHQSRPPKQELPPIRQWPSDAAHNESLSKILKCHVCDRAFENYHMKMLHERMNACKNYKCKCDVCGRRFGSWWKVRRHKTQVHRVKEPGHIQPKQEETIAHRTCDRCGKIFLSVFQKQQHDKFRACDPSRYTCPKCNTRYASRASVLRHMRRTHGVNTSALSMNNSTTSNASTSSQANGITSRAMKESLTEKPSVEVVKCGGGGKKSDEDETGYMSDISSNSGTVPIVEPSVSASAVTTEVAPENGREQSSYTSILEASGTNQCMTCGREFSRSSDLTKHIQYNACDPKLRECQLCGRVLSSKTKLKRHMNLVHSGVKS